MTSVTALPTRRVTLLLEGNADNPNNNITKSMKVDRALESLKKAVQKLESLNTESYADSNATKMKDRCTYVKSATKRVAAVTEVLNSANSLFNVMGADDDENDETNSTNGKENTSLKEIFDPEVGKRRFEKLEALMKQARNAFERDINFENCTKDRKGESLSSVNGSMPLSLAGINGADISHWEQLEKKMSHLKTKLKKLDCIVAAEAVGEENCNSCQTASSVTMRSASGISVLSRPSLKASTCGSRSTRWSGTFSNTTIESLMEDYGQFTESLWDKVKVGKQETGVTNCVDSRGKICEYEEGDDDDDDGDVVDDESRASHARGLKEYCTTNLDSHGKSILQGGVESSTTNIEDHTSTIHVNLIEASRYASRFENSYGLRSLSRILGGRVQNGRSIHSGKKRMFDPIVLGCSLIVGLLLVCGAIMFVRSKSGGGSSSSLEFEINDHGESHSSEQNEEGLLICVEGEENGESHEGHTTTTATSSELEVSDGSRTAEFENSEEELKLTYCSDKCCCLVMTVAALSGWAMSGLAIMTNFTNSMFNSAAADSMHDHASSTTISDSADQKSLGTGVVGGDHATKCMVLQGEVEQLKQDKQAMQAEIDGLKLDAVRSQQRIVELEQQIEAKNVEQQIDAKNADGHVPTKHEHTASMPAKSPFCKCLNTTGICFATIALVITEIALPFIPEHTWKNYMAGAFSSSWPVATLTQCTQNNFHVPLQEYISTCMSSMSAWMNQVWSVPHSTDAVIQKSAIISGLSAGVGCCSGLFVGCAGCVLRAIIPEKFYMMTVPEKCLSTQGGKMKKYCMVGFVGVLVLGFGGEMLYGLFEYFEQKVEELQTKLHSSIADREQIDYWKAEAKSNEQQIQKDDTLISQLKAEAAKNEQQMKNDDGQISHLKAEVDTKERTINSLRSQISGQAIHDWEAGVVGCAAGAAVVAGVAYCVNERKEKLHAKKISELKEHYAKTIKTIAPVCTLAQKLPAILRQNQLLKTSLAKEKDWVNTLQQNYSTVRELERKLTNANAEIQQAEKNLHNFRRTAAVMHQFSGDLVSKVLVAEGESRLTALEREKTDLTIQLYVQTAQLGSRMQPILEEVD